MQADEMIAKAQRRSRQQSLSLTMTSLRRCTAHCSHGVTETKLIAGIVSARNSYDPDASRRFIINYMKIFTYYTGIGR